MKDKKKTIITIVLVAIVSLIAGAIAIYTCYHSWEDATCTKPKTCSICEKTKREALGHKWNDATCTEPQTCSVCQETKEYNVNRDGTVTPGTQAVLYAKQNSSGQSKGEIKEMMRYYGYTEEQINNALKQAGF